MRKKLAKLLAAAMCVSCLGIHAAAAELTFNGNISTGGAVSVNGYGNEGLVSVEVVPGKPDTVTAASGNAIIVDVTAAGADGAFNFVWSLPENEKFPPLETSGLEPKYYTAIISNTGQETDADSRKLLLCYATDAMIAQALASVNGAATAADLAEVLDLEKDDAYILQLGGLLSVDVFTQQPSLVAEGILSQKQGDFTMEALRTAASRALGYAALKGATADTLSNVVRDYGVDLGLDTTKYESDAKLKSAMERCVATVMAEMAKDGTFAKIEDAPKAFKQVEAVAAVNIATRDKVVDVIESYKDVYGIDTTTLGNKKAAVGVAIAVNSTANEYPTAAAVIKAYNDAAAAPGDDDGGGGSSSNNNGNNGILPGSGNTGGGYYGGGSGSLPNIEVEAPEKEQPEINKPFNDLDSVPWAEEYINALASAGIINGKAEGIFAPNDSVTREEFTKMLALALELPEATTASNFSDVAEGAWYVPYVNAVAEAGLIKGYEDGTFGIGTPIIREEAAVLIARAMDYKKLEIGAAEVTFTDTLEISEFAIDSVAICVGARIIQGNDANQFLPRNAITRAECAKMIYCLMELF